jgi:hypothetical protein
MSITSAPTANRCRQILSEYLLSQQSQHLGAVDAEQDERLVDAEHWLLIVGSLQQDFENHYEHGVFVNQHLVVPSFLRQTALDASELGPLNQYAVAHSFLLQSLLQSSQLGLSKQHLVAPSDLRQSHAR